MKTPSKRVSGPEPDPEVGGFHRVDRYCLKAEGIREDSWPDRIEAFSSSLRRTCAATGVPLEDSTIYFQLRGREGFFREPELPRPFDQTIDLIAGRPGIWQRDMWLDFHEPLSPPLGVLYFSPCPR